MTNVTDVVQLTTETLKFYGLENAHLKRLGGIDNTNFQVSVGAASYVLHLYAARHDRAAIASELMWLSSLRNDAGLTVPEPVANRTGELVSSVTQGGVEKFCTLMR